MSVEGYEMEMRVSDVVAGLVVDRKNVASGASRQFVGETPSQGHPFLR